MKETLADEKVFFSDILAADKKFVIDKLLAGEILSENEWLILLDSNWSHEETEAGTILQT